MNHQAVSEKTEVIGREASEVLFYSEVATSAAKKFGQMSSNSYDSNNDTFHLLLEHHDEKNASSNKARVQETDEAISFR